MCVVHAVTLGCYITTRRKTGIEQTFC